MSVKIFIVFHKAIDERAIFEPFSASEIDQYFALYATNEKFPSKIVTRSNGETSVVTRPGTNILFEYDLGWHDPLLQSRGFLETSCYVHVLNNHLHAPFDYIGVTQYDMRWTPEAAAALRALGTGSVPDERIGYGIVCGALMRNGGQFHELAFSERFNWRFLLASYNRFFSQRWDISVLIDKPLTLCQTYILPRAQYVDLARWLETLCGEVFPWANQPPYQTHWGVLSGYMERAESLFIAARIQEGQLHLRHLPLVHDTSLPKQLGVSKDHYGVVQTAHEPKE